MVFVDRRLFRTPRWFLNGPPKDYWMLVPQELLNSVVFLGQRTGDGEHFGGTGFFASVPATLIEGGRHVYLVTARHCVEDPAGVPRRDLIMRINNPDAEKGTIPVDLLDGSEWSFHPEPASGQDYVDLAAISIRGGERLSEAGYRWVPQSMFFDESVLGDDPSTGAGIGDEVVCVGLLKVHHGVDRNAPVVRMGNLALVPDDPLFVYFKDGRRLRMRLYLSELRSISGLSGSPVFLRHRTHALAVDAPLSLLGVMVGHWDDGDGNHMGFGKIVPAELLGELLGQEELVKGRLEAEQRRLAEGPVAHQDEAQIISDEGGDEFAQFEDLTRKLVQVPKKELDEKRKES